MTDDISATFHRVLYHPDMGPAFAAVWKDWLVIPVPSIFGARDAPGNYIRKGELRAHFGNFARLTPATFDTPLIKRLCLPPTPLLRKWLLLPRQPLTPSTLGSLSVPMAPPSADNPPLLTTQVQLTQGITSLPLLPQVFTQPTSCSVIQRRISISLPVLIPQNGRRKCSIISPFWVTISIHGAGQSVGPLISETSSRFSSMSSRTITTTSAGHPPQASVAFWDWLGMLLLSPLWEPFDLCVFSTPSTTLWQRHQRLLNFDAGTSGDMFAFFPASFPNSPNSDHASQKKCLTLTGLVPLDS
jgi:hypothetical protein